jgi:hypothetical protein
VCHFEQIFDEAARAKYRAALDELHKFLADALHVHDHSAEHEQSELASSHTAAMSSSELSAEQQGHEVFGKNESADLISNSDHGADRDLEEFGNSNAMADVVNCNVNATASSREFSELEVPVQDHVELEDWQKNWLLKKDPATNEDVWKCMGCGKELSKPKNGLANGKKKEHRKTTLCQNLSRSAAHAHAGK